MLDNGPVTLKLKNQELGDDKLNFEFKNGWNPKDSFTYTIS